MKDLLHILASPCHIHLLNYSMRKKWMPLVLAIQHWRPYLLCQKFTVFTD